MVLLFLSHEVSKRYHDEYVLACSEVILDSEENIWFHMYPSDTVKEGCVSMLNQDYTATLLNSEDVMVTTVENTLGERHGKK